MKTIACLSDLSETCEFLMDQPIYLCDHRMYDTDKS